MGIQDRYKSRKLDQLISFSFFAHPNVLFYHIPVFVIDIFFSLLILAAGSLVVLAKGSFKNYVEKILAFLTPYPSTLTFCMA